MASASGLFLSLWREVPAPCSGSQLSTAVCLVSPELSCFTSETSNSSLDFKRPYLYSSHPVPELTGSIPSACFGCLSMSVCNKPCFRRLESLASTPKGRFLWLFCSLPIAPSRGLWFPHCPHHVQQKRCATHTRVPPGKVGNHHWRCSTPPGSPFPLPTPRPG